MASSRISYNTNLSSSVNERRQVQTRIRALQQRSNALHEELTRSSSVAKSAVLDIERAYMAITNEFRDERDQLLRRLHHVKKNIKQSTHELDTIRKNLDTAQSFRLPQISPRYSNDHEVHEMNAMVNDIERVLNNIAQQLKRIRFVPSRGHALGKTLGTIRLNDHHHHHQHSKGKTGDLSELDLNSEYSPMDVSLHKLYTVDLDISAQWVIASMDKRIFLCDTEGEIRIFSYSREMHRQPLLIERFHLSTSRLITSFTITQDYLIAFESDTQNLTLHTHHGALLLRLYFLYNPAMIIRGDYRKKNQIWICNRLKRQCYQLQLNHTTKETNVLDQLDFTQPIGNVFIEPKSISTDEQGRIAVHDVNQTTADRLVLFTNKKNTIFSLDCLKYDDKSSFARIERVVLVPKQPHLIIVLYVPQPSLNNLQEVVLVNIQHQSPQILHRMTEPNGIQNLDLTLNNELVYTVTTPSNKRMPPKMHIYTLFS